MRGHLDLGDRKMVWFGSVWVGGFRWVSHSLCFGFGFGRSTGSEQPLRLTLSIGFAVSLSAVCLVGVVNLSRTFCLRLGWIRSGKISLRSDIVVFFLFSSLLVTLELVPYTFD